MAQKTLKSLVGDLFKDRLDQKVIVSDQAMIALVKAADSQRGVISTPPDELRHIEGLVELPYGYLTKFNVVPSTSHRCANGRVPTALEIVAFALRRRVHDKSLIRDTLIGLQNIVELARDGRQGG